MKKMKKIASLVFASVLGGVFALGGFFLMTKDQDTSKIAFKAKADKPRVFNTSYIPTATNLDGEVETIDFTKAAEETVNAVVHVKNMAVRSANSFEDFFYGRRRGNTGERTMVGAGSGVIIDPNGYIITNNHVIQGASDIEISLNNGKNLKAEVIGKDAHNDIALLKVNHSEDLPYVSFGDSDNIKVGEWVLAVGNPLNLTSTVTAGIVSAKSRNIGEGNVNDNKVESFIQTDAAVNSGNSGGALVNTRGELIGINTAITSRTGSFEGYSFAVPSNIAKKVVEDLLEFGDVQEALIGIGFKQSQGEIEGVTITKVEEEGGAEKAGLKPNDVITKINDVKIHKFSDLKGQLSAKRPGEEIVVTVLRDGNELEKNVVLGSKNYHVISDLGVRLNDLTKKDKKVYGIESGAKITANRNKYFQYYGITEGYIVTKVNNQKVKNSKEAKTLIEKNLRGYSPLNIEMIDLKGNKKVYAFKE